MKKSILILLTMVFVSSNWTLINGQGSNSGNHTFITFDGLTFINPVNPRFRLGVARDLSPKIKVGLEVGYGSENMTLVRDFYLGYYEDRAYKFLEFRGQVYYHFAPEGRINQYLSAEVYTLNHEEIIFDEYFYDVEDNTEWSFDQADFKRIKTGAQIKYGFFTSPNAPVGVNIYAGIGFRIKENSFKNIEDLRLVSSSGTSESFGFTRSRGTSTGLDASIGLKLFFRL